MRTNSGKASFGLVIGVAIVLTIFGILSYSLWEKNKTSDDFLNKQLDERCLQKADPGMCRAYIPSYYFDTETETCNEFVWGGCEGSRPFETLDECQLACEGDSSKKSEEQMGCEEADGTWIAEHNECEYIGEATCTQLDGTFNECESACRHVISEEPVACTANCVPVCDF